MARHRIISPSPRVKAMVPLLVVSVLIGACAALAASAIGTVTSSTLSPLGGGLLGAAFGVAGGFRTMSGRGGLTVAAVRGLVAGLVAALVIALLQR
jgi:hypothetical protein